MSPLDVNHHGFKSCNNLQIKREFSAANNVDNSKVCVYVPLLFTPIRCFGVFFPPSIRPEICALNKLTALLWTRHIDSKILNRFPTDSLNSLRLWPSFCFIYFISVAYIVKDRHLYKSFYTF